MSTNFEKQPSKLSEIPPAIESSRRGMLSLRDKLNTAKENFLKEIGAEYLVFLPSLEQVKSLESLKNELSINKIPPEVLDYRDTENTYLNIYLVIDEDEGRLSYKDIPINDILSKKSFHVDYYFEHGNGELYMFASKSDAEQFVDKKMIEYTDLWPREQERREREIKLANQKELDREKFLSSFFAEVQSMLNKFCLSVPESFREMLRDFGDSTDAYGHKRSLDEIYEWHKDALENSVNLKPDKKFDDLDSAIHSLSSKFSAPINELFNEEREVSYRATKMEQLKSKLIDELAIN